MHIESAAATRCGINADELGERLEDAGQAVCDDCAFAVLHDASDAEDSLAQLQIDRARAPEESLERSHKVALAAVRALIRTVPSTGDTDLLAEAERHVHHGEAGPAIDLLRQWRADMRTLGVLPSA